jgi:hypothetical protein
MPPGYMYPCPAGYHLPLTPWVTAAWGMAYALWVEAALLALGLLGLRLRRFVSQGIVVSSLVVIGCALLATTAAIWAGYRNSQLCFYTRVRYTPELGALWTRANAAAIAQANIVLSVIALVFLIGTFLTARTLVLGWRGRRRATRAPSS